ncbi:sulfotransferase family protein [Thioalbus denitrificans]|uniref:Sulfotransferase family protein n=1 Tax=Thioalbus denitrificans TaxID=547122 RepID=A0A369CL93_9GAMM|nr:sulfotransferase family protein [Thioalbus denitrificans]
MNTMRDSALGRTANFARNMQLETLLKDINSLLWESEKTLLRNHKPAKWPVVLIMGSARSGTTLLLQWLANTGVIAYPTNLLSRFYHAPIIGAKIQLLLTDDRYNFRDELNDLGQKCNYVSENGKTKGVLAPNEFWYFWRRFLTEPCRDVWTNEEMREGMDAKTMAAELYGIIDVFNKPFVTKGMLFNYNIELLDSILDKVLFIHMHRDPVENVASLIDARRRQLGSSDAWYSFKIPEYARLSEMNTIQQVAGQVHYINQAVRRGLNSVDNNRKLVVQYKELCDRPADVFERVMKKIGMASIQYKGPGRFENTREGGVKNRREIEDALRFFDRGLTSGGS